VKPRRIRAGDVLDSQQKQVGELTTRLRMAKEGSRIKWQDGRSARGSRANLWNTAYCWITGDYAYSALQDRPT
jgi:hypothetical protein